MEPRPYQAEAFDAARKDNVVMVGATGVGKVKHRADFGVKYIRRRHVHLVTERVKFPIIYHD